MSERSSTPSPEQVRETVGNLLASSMFVASRQQSRFLAHVVDETLNGRGRRLKEVSLAIDVFGRDQDFDPRVDSIVRVEASRLRAKLEKYYETAGHNEAVVIDLPKGGYVPTFRYRESREDVHAPVAGTPPKAKREFRGWERALIVVLVVVTTFLLVDRLANRDSGNDSSASSSPQRETIAVLPFANRSQSESDTLFVDGIHDDLLTRLARVGSWNVISRTSVERFRDTTESLTVIGAALGATSVIQGSVQRAGDRVRVSVQLIDANTDNYIWADTYDRELSAANMFAIQSEIAEVVADALQTTLSPAEQRRLGSVPTENLAAYEAYLRGKLSMEEATSGGAAAAQEHFARAIELDPEFARAYIGLADSYFSQMYLGTLGDDAIAAMERAVTTGLALDPDLGEGYAALGNLRFRQADYVAAESAFLRAIELSPNSSNTYYWRSRLLANLGRFEDALASAQIADTLDPQSSLLNAWEARSLSALGRFGEALSIYEQILDEHPLQLEAIFGIAALKWTVYGQLGEAADWYERALTAAPENPFSSGLPGLLLLDLGDDGGAERLIDRAMSLGPSGIWTHWHRQLLHAYRGEDADSIEVGYAGLAVADWLRFEEPVLLPQILGNSLLRAGRFSEAQAFIDEYYPELVANEPRIDRSNHGAAVTLAFLLHRTGDVERANSLLDDTLAFIQTIPRLGSYGYGIADVQIYALLGRNDLALAALRTALDEGWGYLWWYWLDKDPSLDALRSEPEFIELVERTRSAADDLARQLRSDGSLDGLF